MQRLLRFEPVGIILGVLLLVALTTALHGWPTTLFGNLFTIIVLAGGCALAWWRTRPRLAAVTSLGLFLVAVLLPGWFPDSGLVLFSAAFAVLALGWSGRAAWVAAVCGAAYFVVFSIAAHIDGVVAALMLTVPPFLAGTALRLRRETAMRLAERARELEAERELYAEIAVQHERTRIAGELHDIVGHAISVMVIQAAAGKRLVDQNPARAQDAFAAIAESAREGGRDLVRLLDLLGRGESDPRGAPDLDLVEEVVRRAGRSGLNVTCRLQGDRDDVAPPVGQLGFRVVQESLTNALRYAPGAAVRITLTVEPARRELVLRIENDHVPARPAPIAGTGRGLLGLRERVVALGGRFSAGETGTGGWTVEARLPASLESG
jgi:signal transduction histidine kinase